MQINRRDGQRATIVGMKLTACLVVCLTALPLAPVAAQGGATVLVGRDADNGPVCFLREKGDTHQLDIGIGRAGAFVKLDTPEPRDTTARNPVRVHAGDEIVVNDKSSGRFKLLATFDGEARLTVPKPDRASFLLQATGDPAPFLATVAAARGKFLVIESRNKPGELEYVAVYDFDRTAAQALLACARANVN